MTERKQPKIIVTCQKCGRVWESEFELIDQTACPVCGVHGKITSANARQIRMNNGQWALVPAA